MGCDVLRLFVAVNFSRETRERLATLQDELRTRSARGGFTALENLHLTLAFLGDCDPRQTAAAKAAVGSTQFEPFDMRFDRIGCFGRERESLWWAGVSASKALMDLHGALTRALATAGFEPERRKYSPHVTLARQVETDARSRSVEPFSETVNGIHLMKSERVYGKLTYTSI